MIKHADTSEYASNVPIADISTSWSKSKIEANIA